MAVLPTGFGKSLICQIIPKMLECLKNESDGTQKFIVCVVSPLFASKLMSNPTLLRNSANTMPSEVKQILPVNSLFLVTVNKGMAAPTGKLSLQK